MDADGPKLLLLQNPQEFHLQIERQFADLVEECSAAVGEFDQPGLVIVRPGEGALRVAEQLTLHQRSDHGRTVDGDEVGVGVGFVDGTGDEFLAGARFPQEQNRPIPAAEFLGETENLAQSRRMPYQFMFEFERHSIHTDRSPPLF